MGAGGTTGGTGRFFLGIIMMIGGFYLLLKSIRVTANFGMGMRIASFSGMGNNFNVTGGMIMIPFMFGVGMIFYNSKNMIGWLLALGSIAAMIFGVISSTRFSLQSMSSFDLIVILVLAIGGLGLFLSSLRSSNKSF